MVKSQMVAEAIIAFCQESDHPVTCRKLQMLMYYLQGWHLASEDEPLFDEAIHASPHGPVIASVHKKYKGHTDRPIKVAPIAVRISKSLHHHIEEGWNTYGEMAEYDLCALIQGEAPWQEALEKVPEDSAHYPVISNGSLWVFFQDALLVTAGR